MAEAEEEADVEVEEDYEGDEPEQEEEEPEEEEPVEYPLSVLYCKVCSLPPEYCSFGSKKVRVKCAQWLNKTHPDLLEAAFGDEAPLLLKIAAGSEASSAKDDSMSVTDLGEEDGSGADGGGDGSEPDSDDNRVDEIPSEELGRAKGSRKKMTKREMKKQRQRQKSLKGASKAQKQQSSRQKGGGKKAVSFAESVDSGDEDSEQGSSEDDQQDSDEEENGFRGEYTQDAWGDGDSDDEDEEKYPSSALGTVPESSTMDSESKVDSSSTQQSKAKKKKKKASKAGVKGKDPNIPKKIIEVSKTVRKGRKQVTLVTGLENFAAKPQKFQSIFRKRFATGVGFDKHETGVTDLVIQGEHCYDVITFLHSKYKVPANLLWYKLKNGRVERAIGTDGTIYPPP